MKDMIKRILASVLLLVSILFLPFWVAVVLALFGMIYFHIFLEAVFLFLLSDVLYGVPEAKFFGITFISFIISALFLLALELFKKKLRFNS
jgi:hypothetical protein